jgi:hypothetical protein
MTLAEAVKKGKKIKRPCHVSFGWLAQNGSDRWLYLDTDTSTHTPPLSIQDIIADDWMFEEKQIIITKTLLVEAFLKTFNELKGNDNVFVFRDALVENLGLKE